MKYFHLFHLKNAMLIANFFSNLIGVSVAMFLSRIIPASVDPNVLILPQQVDLFFTPIAFIVTAGVTLVYERPVRGYLNKVHQGASIEENHLLLARRRLLNEPFVLICFDMMIWLFAAILFPYLFWISGADKTMILRPFTMSLFTGLITITIAFFVFEFILQKRLAPHFFPKGGLHNTPKTIRIRIRTRLTAFLFACNLIPFLAILRLLQETSGSTARPELILAHLRKMLLADSLIFMGVGIWITFLVSNILTKPLQEIIRVLKEVHNGSFDGRVTVVSNDEIGYTGDVINEMSEGLRERDIIKETFGKYVAPEVRDEVLAGKIPLDGEMKEVTVLFADLRNFTPMTESHDPKLVVRIMNSYFKSMTEAIEAEKGLVLQFLGDEIYAVFGAPISLPDHPERAFQAGTIMTRKLADLNRQFMELGWPQLSHGIGIHSGEAIAASIGSPDRLSYLLVGDTVNLASRLQGLTKTVNADIIISQETRRHLKEDIQFIELPETLIKGKARPVNLFAWSL